MVFIMHAYLELYRTLNTLHRTMINIGSSVISKIIGDDLYTAKKLRDVSHVTGNTCQLQV